MTFLTQKCRSDYQLFSDAFMKQAYNSLTASTNKEIMTMIHLMINIIVQFCRQYWNIVSEQMIRERKSSTL